MANTRETPNRCNKTSQMASKTAKKATKSPKKTGIKKKQAANSQKFVKSMDKKSGDCGTFVCYVMEKLPAVKKFQAI